MSQRRQDSKVFILAIGWIFIVISLIFLPPVFGLLGIIAGILLIKLGKKQYGFIMIIFAILFAILGILFGYLMN